MSRRVGSYVIYSPFDVEANVRALIERVGDLSPVMQPIAYLAIAETRTLLSRGDPDWAPRASSTLERNQYRASGHTIGVGEHGGFAGTLRPFFGRRNAGWKSQASHAHLFALGAEDYYADGDRVARWGSKKKGRTPRGRAAGRDGTRWDGSLRQPPRRFDILSEEFHNRANDRIAMYVLFASLGAVT